jgi:hypothetical protein
MCECCGNQLFFVVSDHPSRHSCTSDAFMPPSREFAKVELQKIMQFCDQTSLLVLARCSRRNFAAAQEAFAWKERVVDLCVGDHGGLKRPSVAATIEGILGSLFSVARIRVLWCLASASPQSLHEGMQALCRLPKPFMLELVPSLQFGVITPAFVRHIAAELQQQPRCAQALSKVLFSSFFFGNYCAIELATLMLGQGVQLETLSLRRCNIEEEGMIALASVLPACSRLTFLDLSHNKASRQALRAMADALMQNRSLKRLWLDLNDITFDGAMLLVEALPACPHLKLLSLECNLISFNEQTRLLRAKEAGGWDGELSVATID